MEQKLVSRNKGLFFLLILGTLLVGVMGWFFYEDFLLRENLVNKEENLHNLELKLAFYDKVKQNYDQLMKKGEPILQHFTDQNDPVEFIQAIEKAGNDAGVTLKISEEKELSQAKAVKATNLSETGTSAPVEPKELSFSVEAEGSFTGLVDFIMKLENLPKYSYVKRVDLVKVERASQEETGELTKTPLVKVEKVLRAIVSIAVKK